MADQILWPCVMCGHVLAVLTLCESCGERFCPVVCWRKHAEDACGVNKWSSWATSWRWRA